MNDILIKKIVEIIDSEVGVTVRGSEDPTGDRSGLAFWFENYNRGSGPVFTIKPTGLKRHTVSLRFGPYAKDCIDHINDKGHKEAFQLLDIFIEELSKNHEVLVSGCESLSNSSISVDFKVDVIRKVSDQKDIESFVDSALSIMPMLIGGVAELIGYEVTGLLDEEAGIEGKESVSTYKRRERNKRNRLLCLNIHGCKCKVCGFEVESNYKNLERNIIEVHHIEPLSELEKARAYDPRKDLIPLCPNCHRAIHTTISAMTPDELVRKLNL
jgi:5-methylcytosine-specific restriction protein A|tara:strand:+ start:1418 stop:2227 length:810 start_codon:yes stop_codon:yes gene_type:complete